ncbi:iron complex transport system permease protein [Streptoalloteichus tenebrarius]|uniref:Iron complex transport system permease protein n=1 Tax=Streptoalloteichus tenebrarius (strain ATCC 17920 / DSM 40477 / JCM 4838 / CBS 697.72 / NBRC 16177 / NCIMB 11028 / NRRL B-12390 / A12253. 1 / ISP 5477) TaxID=1933 RepID=A0ABT1I0A1_STRSD|nr:iron ABC transporter permease [Streptoalloteichus tenebrarius]MCP2261208.1 iron complex transport system permease protein [Streptoalloteichus tenebrarius]BFF02930.1 iron chelate uptake ABC transporter family permease subunit [Streptoalloteichus tenebrarius]
MEHRVPPPPDSVVLRRGALSVLLPRRATLAALGLGVLAAAAVLVSTVVGAGQLSPGQALSALFGEGGRGAVLMVQQFRLPRVIAGLLAGAALGVAGCLTQTVANNRLATPDLLGVTDGATVAILVAVTGSTAGMIGAWWLGPVGAVAAGALVVLAAGGADTGGYRVLVVGLALSVTVRAVTDLVLSQQGLHTSAAVFTWTIGSLNGRGYPVAVPVGIALALLLPLAVLAGRQLSVLRFDDDVAATLGVDPRRARLLVLVMAVLLAGLAVGVGGPIAFVAMAAPVLAARLAGPARVPLVGSALVGGALVVVADTLARVATEHELPVGVVTNILGGPFLLWVLLSDKSVRRF